MGAATSELLKAEIPQTQLSAPQLPDYSSGASFSSSQSPFDFVNRPLHQILFRPVIGTVL